jgi:hypothetical protein
MTVESMFSMNKAAAVEQRQRPEVDRMLAGIAG